MNRELEFTKKDLKKLIIPLIIEQMLAVTVGMADTIMVSSVGEAAVSGVSLVDMINILIINIFAALATGGAVVASQLIGARERDRACLSADQLLLVTFTISIAIMTLSLLLREQLLRLLFGVIEHDVMKNALTYFWISALSFPFIAIYNSCAALFRAMGNSRVSMVTSFVVNIINIVGNAICVYAFHMGVAGVALPTLISRTVGAVIMLVLITDSRREVYVRFKGFKINFGMIRRILYIGIPSGLENSLFQMGRVLVVSIIATFGTVQIAANAVANNLDSLGTIPGQAMSLAMITVVGRCVGARDYEQAKYYIKKLMKSAYIVTIAMNASVILSMPLVLRAYNLSDETLKLAAILVLIHDGCAMLSWPVAFTLPNALRAANDVKFTMIVSIASMWIFRIVFSYILGKFVGWGAIGVWISMIMDWICRLSFFITRYRSGKWQTKYAPMPATMSVGCGT
ncbi:MAG: MATE family efflux transporter [Clostridiaceae bacterium]